MTYGLRTRRTAAISARRRGSRSGSTRTTSAGSPSARSARCRWWCGGATASNRRPPSSRTCTTELARVVGEHFDVRALRRRQHAQHPRPLPRARAAGRRLLRSRIEARSRSVTVLDDVPMRGWGLPRPGELDRVVIVSPHLDDAVLGCGNFMAGIRAQFVSSPSSPATRPLPAEPMRKWDVQCGFAPGDDVMEARRQRGPAALACSMPRPCISIHRAHVQPRRPTECRPECLSKGFARAPRSSHRRSCSHRSVSPIRITT